MSLGKLIRTLQSELAFLKEAKDAFYLVSRRLRRQPSDSDFRALKFIPDSLPGCYLDIGANQGQSIEAIRLFKPQAQIHSFEANPGLARKLQQRYAGSRNIRVLPYGLGDECSTNTLYVPVYKGFVYDGLASFDRNSAAGWLGPHTLYWFSASKLELREVPCSTERLDDQGLDPLFIKIDVEGYEYQVALGGLKTIERCEPVLMVEDIALYPKLAALLQQLGYRQYQFDDAGFYRAEPGGEVTNTLLLTPRRAATVVLSPRHRALGDDILKSTIAQ